MKKYIVLPIVITCMVLILAGCNQNAPTPKSDGSFEPDIITTDKKTNESDVVLGDRRPMVMINGELYLDTNRESDIGGRCGVMDGEISSTVDATEIPLKDNQSNFGDGYSYQSVDRNSVDILMNGKWIRFEKETIDTWGIQLTASKITPLGLTLTCNQSGEKATGGLQTGSPYWLEVQTNNQWVAVEMLPLENELAWTEEAWIISMNDAVEWDLDWSWLYGELPTGKYRIGKEIMDFRDTGDYDTQTYYAGFEIKK